MNRERLDAGLSSVEERAVDLAGTLLANNGPNDNCGRHQ